MKKTNSWNRLLSLVLCLCMVLSLIPAIPLVASAAANAVPYDGTPVTPTKITSGNYYQFGLTESNWSGYNGYYGIRNAKELYGFANLVNSGNTGANAVLLQDIVVNETVAHTTNGAAYTWSPIGNSSHYYTGTFDGNGYTISGLYYNENDYGQSISRIGFFGVLKGATIKNLILSNLYFRAASELSAVAACVVNYGTTISNCLLTSSVTLAVDTSSDYAYTGGFIGNYYEPASVLNWNSTNTINNCVNLGKINLVDSSFTLGHADTSWYYTGAIAGAYRSDSNAYAHVTAVNCYFLETGLIDKNGTTDDKAMGGTNLTATSGRGCTALKSASDSHTCVSVTHKEVQPTCAGYPGRSQYSVCLICGKVTSGSKTDSAAVGHVYMDATCQMASRCRTCDLSKGSKNPDNHVKTLWKVNGADKSTHIYTHECCGIVLKTETHSVDANGYCKTCNYTCEHTNTVNGVCQVCGAKGITYINRYWNGESGQVISSTAVVSEFTTITESTTAMSNGWYVLEGNVTVASRITVSGTVNLLLKDGYTLTASQGITTTGATLNIYGQSGDTGTLVANGIDYAAAIGSLQKNACGTIVINGGTVRATGGKQGAGIGNGRMTSGGSVTVNGGNVYATGGNSATGIGSGDSNSESSKRSTPPSITIHGGYVEARGKASTSECAGIGSGCWAKSAGTITITGGTVLAVGSTKQSSGIGAGSWCKGGTIVITGGNIRSVDSKGTHRIGASGTGSSINSITDGKGNNVSLSQITLNGASNGTCITGAEGLSYGIYDVKTLDTNKLYFYLPSGNTTKYFTVGDTIYCGAGSNTSYSTATHSLSKNYTVDGDVHYNSCTICGTVVINEKHSGGVANCLTDGSCAVCGEVYLLIDRNNHASEDTYIEYINDEYHGLYHACCKVQIEQIAHTPAEGQEATCVGVATCAECGIAYGGKDATNHTGELTYVSNGKKTHIQTYSCCGTPVSSAQGHSLSYTAHDLTIEGICDVCGYSGSVTLIPSSGGTYTGYAFESSYSGTGILGNWDAFAKPTVTGCCEKGCITAGEHTVTMTLGCQSVSATFTIAPKPLTVGLVKANGKSYDGTSDLSVYSVSLDGVVVYDEGDYSGAWDDIRDDVQLVRENLVYTFDGIVPGTYSSVDVSGVTITGNDAFNYVIAESFEDVPLRDDIGYDFEIYNAQIWITAYDQLLTGDAELDQSQYAVEGLEDQFTLQGVSLYENSYSEIEIDPYSISIYLDGEDVTEYFNITVHNGILSRVCEGHEYDDNGFCATGECSSYEPAVKNTAVDEWGNEIEVYEIYNAGQLYWFAEQVNTYGNNYINGKLMEDITVNEDLTAENLRQWTPIGRSWPAYCAIFEGNDHTISGLYVNDPEMDYVGLFGYTDYAYPISNIHLTNSYFEGDSCVGGLFGYAGSYISGCTVSDSVTVKGNNSLGGIVGDTAYGELNNSWSAATVIANENAYYYGGLVGYNNLSINNCYTTGSSLVGVNNDSYGGSVNNSYYLGEEETEDGGKTAAQFASGEVAYLLQSAIQGEDIYDDDWNWIGTTEPKQIWGQTIGTDSYPTLGGAKVYEVTNCKDEVDYSNTDANLDHIYDNACDADCNTCGVIRQILGHGYKYKCDTNCFRCGELTRPEAEHKRGYPDCMDGECAYACGLVMPAIADHSYEAYYELPPTCGTNGAYFYQCKTCGDSYEEYPAATGKHTYDYVCDAKCNICNQIRVADEHSWKDATCTEPKTCTVCGETEGEALGHTEKTVPGYDATCTKSGLTDGVICSVCGEILTAQTAIPTTAHSWVTACTKPKTCSVCGETHGPVLPHNGYEYDGVCDYCGVIAVRVKLEDTGTEYFAFAEAGEDLVISVPESEYQLYCWVADTRTGEGLAEGFVNQNGTFTVSGAYLDGSRTVCVEVDPVYVGTVNLNGGSIIDENKEVLEAAGLKCTETYHERVYYIRYSASALYAGMYIREGYTLVGYELDGVVYGIKDPFTVSGDNFIIDLIWECDHQWKDATCTAPKTCTVCGETEGEALGHSYVDDVCTVCGHIGVPVKLDSASLSFKEKIHYNIFFSLELDETVDLSDMGLFMFDSLNADGTVDDAIAIYSGAVEMDGKYMIATDGVHAKYMGDTIYFRVYAKLADGSYVYSKTVQYSAVTYAEHILAGDEPESAKALVVAMLNYGAAAQQFFGYNTDNLVNAFLTDEQKALPEQYRDDMGSTVPVVAAEKQGIFANNQGFSVRKPAVSFEGAFEINYFFTPAYAPVDGITLYYWTGADFEANEVLTVENASGSLKLEGTEQYRGDIGGIAAKRLSENIYVAAVYSDGTTTWTSGVLGYSIGAYCRSLATRGGTIADLAMATAVYGYHTNAYFCA